jgi:ribosomal protein S18 acetylase RimI-like enzyme
MNMKFNLATESDIDEICALVKSAISNMDRNDIFQWDEIYPTREDFLSDIKAASLFVGLEKSGKDEKEKIVVIYALNKDCDDEYKKTAWSFDGDYRVIHRLCVHPDFQRRGIARETLLHIEKQAVSLGAKSLRLDVFSQNPASMALYEKAGYSKTGEALWRKGLFYLMEKGL